MTSAPVSMLSQTTRLIHRCGSGLRLMFSVLALNILTGVNGVEHTIRSEDLSE
jgi:hypothetical protein